MEMVNYFQRVHLDRTLNTSLSYSEINGVSLKQIGPNAKIFYISDTSSKKKSFETD